MATGFLKDYALARYLSVRSRKRDFTLCKRRSDGTLWAASSPQNVGRVMAGILSRKAGWHFVKVRKWRGLYIVSPKVFWSFDQYRQFDIVTTDATGFWLSPLTYQQEEARLTPTPDAKELSDAQ